MNPISDVDGSVVSVVEGCLLTSRTQPKSIFRHQSITGMFSEGCPEIHLFMSTLRIVSFLPSATEMVCALGLGDRLVGITHECDYPPEVKGKPVVVSSAVPVERMTQAEIDAAVSERVRAGQSVYLVDEKCLRELAPDVILTQDLCQVCAPSGNEVTQALNALLKKPQILWLTPGSLAEIAGNIREIGVALGCRNEAELWIAANFGKIDEIAKRSAQCVSRPRVFCMEWFDPVYCSGHWVPEMVRIAGGVDKLAREKEYSSTVPWNDVLEWAPEVLVLMPCGYHLDQVLEMAPRLQNLPGWSDIPAVRNSQVYAVDASSYFARPGPRVVQGTELLAHLIHPETFSWEGPDTAFRRLAQG
jgi:iron complex transport system substrate-binding protein